MILSGNPEEGRIYAKLLSVNAVFKKSKSHETSLQEWGLLNDHVALAGLCSHVCHRGSHLCDTGSIVLGKYSYSSCCFMLVCGLGRGVGAWLVADFLPLGTHS